MAARDGAASIQGEAIKITPLLVDGSIDILKPILTTSGFISASFGSEFEDGEEITEKAANGSICIQYKTDDSMKGITFNLSLCSPDPEAAALLAGGKIICNGSGEIVGYSSPAVGDIVGNPVAIEIWSKAIVGGKPAAGTPYWHWVFPYVRVRFDGDREFSNGALANEFSGTGVGNAALVTSGLNPANIGDDFVLYKGALDNPFSYVRSAVLPSVGWSGSFVPTIDNSINCTIPVIPPSGVTKGSPGAFTPPSSTVPVNLAELQALGALGQTAAWATRAVGTKPEYLILGDASNAAWTSTAWAAVASVALNVSDLLPAAAAMANLTALKADGVVGDGKGGKNFASGQYIALGDATTAHYKGGDNTTGVGGAWAQGPMA